MSLPLQSIICVNVACTTSSTHLPDASTNPFRHYIPVLVIIDSLRSLHCASPPKLGFAKVECITISIPVSINCGASTGRLYSGLLTYHWHGWRSTAWQLRLALTLHQLTFYLCHLTLSIYCRPWYVTAFWSCMCENRVHSNCGPCTASWCSISICGNRVQGNLDFPGLRRSNIPSILVISCYQNSCACWHYQCIAVLPLPLSSQLVGICTD